MITPLLLSAILVFHDLPSVLSLAEGAICTTPNGETAQCMKIRECEVIYNAVSTRSKESIEFYKRSVSACGNPIKNTILVCCGTAGAILPVYQHRLLPKPSECGLEDPNDRIFYGEETGIHKFPWMALLLYSADDETRTFFACGGSLINKRYVLTAAHCVVKLRRGEQLIGVRLGEHNLATDRDCTGDKKYEVCNPPVRNYGIETTIAHDEYRKKRKVHDIALLRLDSDVEFAEHIKPVCLPEETTPSQVGKTVTVAGWGETEGESQSKAKVKAILTVLPLLNCTSLYGKEVVINDNQYCALGLCIENKKCSDSCGGDSGGPSVRPIQDSGKFHWLQEGITSFGTASICGEYPAVYTKVSKYVKWIGDNLKD